MSRKMMLGDETYAFGGKTFSLREKAGTLADGAEKVIDGRPADVRQTGDHRRRQKHWRAVDHEVTKETTAELAAD